MKVWVVLGVDVGCCPGCEGGYCQEYAEGTPVNSIHKEPFCRWGHGQGKPTDHVGKLCTSCQIPGQIPLWEEAS